MCHAFEIQICGGTHICRIHAHLKENSRGNFFTANKILQVLKIWALWLYASREDIYVFLGRFLLNAYQIHYT